MAQTGGKDTLYFRGKQAIKYNFTAEELSSDGGVVLLSKLERTYGLISAFSSVVPDSRNPEFVVHEMDKLIRQRVFLMCLGYEDCNDSDELRYDPVIREFVDEEFGLASQPTLSRLENSVRTRDIYNMVEFLIDRYVSGIKAGKKRIILDIDSTDDPTHGNQQLSLFHGYYYQHMYHILLVHDGESGEVIAPVLRAGNVHTAAGAVSLLKRIVRKIRKRFADIQIIIRADAGFSNPDFYTFVNKENIKFCIGISSNSRLKTATADKETEIRKKYADQNIKHQHMEGPLLYQADSWEKPQQVWAKIESTGKGMNVRYIVSNMKGSGAELYWGFYVKRAEHSENRIKELKNMCFADRLSCHGFHANFFRLILACLAYELMRLLKNTVAKTNHPQAGRWQIQTLRLNLLKVAAYVIKRVRTIHICFSKAYPRQALFRQVAVFC